MDKKRHQKGLSPLPIGLLATEEQIRQVIRERVDEEMRRMCALAESMGIPEGSSRWYSVAVALARMHVPELREAKPMGAPRKWGDFELGMLSVEMRRARESRKPKLNEEEAAAQLSTKQPWRSYLQKKGGSYLGPDPVAALLKAYAQAKKSKFSAIAWDSYLYHQHFGLLDEWDAQVRSVSAK